MRLNINLASQPYQNVGRVVIRWSLAVVAVALVTVALTYAALTAYISWRSVNSQQRELRGQIAEREKIRSQAEAFLNRPENRTTRDQAQFINSLIARKAFSWTEVLAELESMMPPGIHVVNIRPAINQDSQLEVHLTVAGSSRDHAIELVRRLEKSSHFHDAAMVNEVAQQDKQATKLQFEITAIYVPNYEHMQPAPATQTSASAQQGGQ